MMKKVQKSVQDGDQEDKNQNSGDSDVEIKSGDNEDLRSGKE